MPPPRAARREGRRCHAPFALSVVGTERLQESGCFPAKQAYEQLIRDSDVPFSIVHATQFFEFMKGIADSATKDDNTVHLAPSRSSPSTPTTPPRWAVLPSVSRWEVSSRSPDLTHSSWTS